MPIYFPPLTATATGNEENLVIGGQVFRSAGELAALRHATLQTFLGLGSTSTTADDASAILATQVFGP